jgi:hypothetical protein
MPLQGRGREASCKSLVELVVGAQHLDGAIATRVQVVDRAVVAVTAALLQEDTAVIVEIELRSALGKAGRGAR